MPLALPVMMAGIRTAAVWVIGTATLSTPIGQTSLGNYIFAGLQTQNWVFVLFGCAAAALLALAVDQLLALDRDGLARKEQPARGARRHRARRTRRRHARAVAGAHHADLCRRRQDLCRAICALSADRAKDCRPPSLGATTREGLGSNVIFEALVNGDIDVYVDYSGTLWTNQFHHIEIKPRQQLLAELKTELARQKSRCSANSASRTPMRW